MTTKEKYLWHKDGKEFDKWFADYYDGSVRTPCIDITPDIKTLMRNAWRHARQLLREQLGEELSLRWKLAVLKAVEDIGKIKLYGLDTKDDPYDFGSHNVFPQRKRK